MSSSGNPESSREQDSNSGVPWYAIALLAGALLIAIFVGLRVGGVLAGLLFPPSPPLPAGATTISHTQFGYGSDDWVYQIRPAPCFVVGFYEDEGATCTLEPGHCAATETTPQSAQVATCTGRSEFSAFTMQWEASISAYPEHVEILLSRRTAWLSE